MTISTLSSPVTGGAQTGLTSPTYTLTADTAPDSNGRQWVVTALGGTQTGVSTHSVASPFSLTFWRPKIGRILGNPNINTGVIANVPKNTYKWIVRKGVAPLAGQPIQTAVFTLQCDVPAGSDTADAEDVRAALSLLIGAVNQMSAGTGDTLCNGVM
jgi:hypothetical protein